MKILIIRHGEPDYSIDSLTDKGWREAEYLSEMLVKQLSDSGRDGDLYFYMSPYGRAQDTASSTLKKLGRTAEVLPWLREFDYFIWRPDDTTRKRIPWDWYPADWVQDPRLYQADHWFENELMAEGSIGEAYRGVTEQFDELLARHGYIREGKYYRAERSSHDTIVMFCHFGVTSVLTGHLTGVSPCCLWQGFFMAPSSVTVIASEERDPKTASFRVQIFGDTAHLSSIHEPVSSSGYFGEVLTI